MDYGASDLRERVEVLALTEAGDGWNWTPVRETWAGVEVTDRNNLFSRVGIGARDVSLVLRKQELTLHQALRWRGRFLFLTSLTETKPGWLEGKAALVEVVGCRGDVHLDSAGKGFPGVLTEKYLRYEQEEPMTAIGREYVLVTPKPVVLQRNGLVEVDGLRWVVRLDHTLDPYKNEYEIFREGEC